MRHIREFVEKEADRPSEEEPGLERFLRDRVLSGGATDEEIEFLKRLRFNGKRPTPLYYYRELQSLRDASQSITFFAALLLENLNSQAQSEKYGRQPSLLPIFQSPRA